MDFLELVKDRWSVRKFKSDQIRQEELDQILEAGKYAPTAVNFQPQKIYILKSDLAMKKINSVCKCVFGAPMAILIAVDTERAWKNPFTGHLYGDVDIGIVATHMMLMAWELGIGTCPVGHFDSREVAKTFELPKNEVPALLLPIGYPAKDAEPLRKLHDSFRDREDVVKEF